MTEIKPALTPEEWRAGIVIIKPGSRTQTPGDWGGPIGFEFYLKPHDEASNGLLWAFDDSWAVMMTEERRHAIAAVCLRGQPFGFTREDVRLVRGRARSHDPTDELYDLADRIEALLPPPETKT